MIIPLSWSGFTAIDMKGYEEKVPTLDVISQQEEFWGYHQALSASLD